jgi:tRNA 2-thiouridine synthesizing protein B
MILHTVNRSPQHHHALRSCLPFIGPEDVLLLLEDGVYAATPATAGLLAGTKTFAVRADIEARGLATHLSESITLIDYEGFVRLCVQYPVIKHWS